MNKVAIALIALTACAADADLDSQESELISTSSLSMVQLNNAKTAANAIGTNSLSSNSAAIQTLVSTADGRAVFTKTVACALAAGSSVTATDSSGNVYTFNGAHGLSTSWATSVPTASQRRWVTGCVLATTNFSGLATSVSLRHDTYVPLLSTAAERSTYSVVEGAYYGDLYTPGGQLYVCASQIFAPSGNPFKESIRNCARSSNGTTTQCGYNYTWLCGATLSGHAAACTDKAAPYGSCLGGSTRLTEVVTLYTAP